MGQHGSARDGAAGHPSPRGGDHALQGGRPLGTASPHPRLGEGERALDAVGRSAPSRPAPRRGVDAGDPIPPSISRDQGAMAPHPGRVHDRLHLPARSVVRRRPLRQGPGRNAPGAGAGRARRAPHAGDRPQPVVGVVREVASRRIRNPVRTHPCHPAGHRSRALEGPGADTRHGRTRARPLRRRRLPAQGR